MSEDIYEGIAIIGMACRFPGARTLDEFWTNLCQGVESIRFFSREELREEGIDATLLDDPNYVKANAMLDDIELFDAAFFGLTPREAQITDPQHRLFLECAWESLEHAGYNSEDYDGKIGVYAGAGMSSYFLSNLLPNPRLLESVTGFQLLMGSDKDYVPTRTSYKLNLKGPSININTACSTSLVATHLACQGLLDYHCDMALAGGVGIHVPQKTGYAYQEGGILSPDGHCRAFDAKAGGTINGSGAGIVVLKRLEDALQDGDSIYAVIKGSSVNNDGSDKVGFTAPSVNGQAEVILEAQTIAEIEPETITYIETHGTGTVLGDPIEIAALTKAFRSQTDNTGFCAIGSVKTNFGHLDAAAGAAGLIKTVLALKHKMIPPSLNFEQPNPAIDFESSPFYVNTRLSEWNTHGTPRRAGVSSFGIGGTNAHVVLEEAPAPPLKATPPPAPPQRGGVFLPSPLGRGRGWGELLLLSAKTESALNAAANNFAQHLKQHPDINLADVAYTLQVGRKAFPHRRVVVCQDVDDAIHSLESSGSTMVFSGLHEDGERPVLFMFSGQGSQYVNMGLGLYKTHPLFRDILDRCDAMLRPHLDMPLLEVLYPPEGGTPNDRLKAELHTINQTAYTQPALFVIEYALAQLFMAWGVRPTALIGHSLGEYVAATVSGVLALEDALALVAARGNMMQQLPAGSMLAVPLSEQEILPFLDHDLALATINGPTRCVVSGTTSAIRQLQERLARQDVQGILLHTSHAFHSAMMEPILSSFIERVHAVRLNPPQIPYISNVSGTWITDAEATDPNYWAAHIRQTVRFSDGLEQLYRHPDAVCLEIGPGKTLSTFALRHPAKTQQHTILSSVPSPKDSQPAQTCLLTTVGRLWLAGVPVDWNVLSQTAQRHRIPLPTYPFERQRYWSDPPKQDDSSTRQIIKAEPVLEEPHPDDRAELADWFYVPQWERTPPLGAGLLGSMTSPPAPLQRRGETPSPSGRVGEGFSGEPNSPPLLGARTSLSAHDHIEVDNDVRTSHSSWLLFLDEYGLGTQLVQRLQQQGQSVITVTAGTIFHKIHDNGYTLSPSEEEGYQTLMADLCASGRLPDRIVHLWSVSPDDAAPVELARLDEAQERGLYSLFAIVKALDAQQALRDVCFTVVSNSMQDVSGEGVLFPEKATLLGAVNVIPQEFPHIKMCSIDIDLPCSPDILYREVTGTGFDRNVAYRHEHRWIQTIRPVRLDAAAGIGPHLKEGGVYLITGGLGGIGLTLAEYLVKTVRAKLVLTGRSTFPKNAEWEDWLLTHDSQDRISRKIHALQRLKSLGGDVLVRQADVADREQMQHVLTETFSRFGQLHGVIHAAGMPDGALIANRDRATIAHVLEPKVQGTLVLTQLLEDVPLDLFVLCSSLSSLLGSAGQIAYCAANAFLDAFAHVHHVAKRGFTVSINWDAWRDVGMAVETSDWKAWQAQQQETVVPIFTPCSSPLFEQYYAQGTTLAMYITRLHPDRNWLLDEHRIMGKAVLPGTAYLELVRSAFAHYMQHEGHIVLQDVYFLTPLFVEEQQEQEVRIILKRQGDGYEFCVISRLGEDQWQRHATGMVASLEAAPEQRLDLKLLETACAEEKVDLSEMSANQDASFLTRRLEAFGPRWRNVQYVARSQEQGLAFLRLPQAYCDDLDVYRLHPALLDIATGILVLCDRTHDVLPFSYKSIRIWEALPDTIYSYLTQTSPQAESTLVFDVIITDEQGRVLVEIEEYTLRPFQSETNRHSHQEANYALEITSPGILDTLNFRSTERRTPGPSDVEIEVRATGLNFKEVLFALGMLPLPEGISPQFGLECAGTIVAIGEEVTTVQIGDDVIAFAPASFSAYTTTPASSVVKKPEALSFEEAATIPAAFMTAYYALITLGRLSSGEQVLIHSAAGGVGMAAVGIAQWVGAEIFATAGTPEKRSYLQSVGIQHVMDSHSLLFVDEVLAQTKGRGVDVVLNSLGGEFIPKSLSVLAPYGRFLELGVRDIYNNTPLGLQAFAKCIAFFAVGVGPDMPHFHSIFEDVVQHFDCGDFSPLPLRVFQISDTIQAFEYMAQARHIGKIIISRKTGEFPGISSAAKPDRGISLRELLEEPEARENSDVPISEAEWLDHAITPSEGIEVFRRIVSSSYPQVVVSTQDLLAHLHRTHSDVGHTGEKQRELQSAQQQTGNSIEETIIEIWKNLIGVSQIGVHDNFFEIGGDSLLAAQANSRFYKALQVKLPLSQIFKSPTAAGLAQYIADSGNAGHVRPPLERSTITPMPKQAHDPVSHAQKRLWLASQTDEGSAAYNVSFNFCVEGALHVSALESAIRQLMARHESLRTTFHLFDGELRQQVWDEGEMAFRIRTVGLAEAGPQPEATARELIRQDALTPFDLERGPLLRMSLIHIAEQRWVLLFTMHHIISDGWSLGVITRELSQFYRAACQGRSVSLPPLSIQYRDYAHWYDRMLKSEEMKAHRHYWHEKLSGDLPALELPIDFDRSSVMTFKGASVLTRISGEHYEHLRQFVQQQHVSLFMTLVAAVKLLLACYSGQDEVIVGSPVAGRDFTELENQIGLYLNTVALRDHLSPDATVETILQQVKHTVTQAFDHQLYPFDRLVDELHVSPTPNRSPLFDVLVNLQLKEREFALDLGDLRITPFMTETWMAFVDLNFMFGETEDGVLLIEIQYAADIFAEETVQRMGRDLITLLQEMIEAPTRTLKDLRERRISHEELREQEAFMQASMELTEDF